MGERNCEKYYHRRGGGTLTELLALSPPTKANRAQSQAGSPDFRKWESCRTMPLVGGFSRGSPPPPFHSWRRSIFTLITLIGSQDLAASPFVRGVTGRLRVYCSVCACAEISAASRGLTFFCLRIAIALEPRVTDDSPRI
ncbi:hypothetical protein PR048_017931 [Dryococelus australis]|uniref:Uncharacterized protein n=1 Tax=Dryococelus australis TaxID=614101 RepID=A0ABQ9HB11_9NEOP|nr:hypothetical protein PR048_017931 [Dryococelus australis]